MSYTVVLPTLNESGHIEKLIKEIQNIFSEIKKDYEIIVVDDNSNDGTIECVEKLKNSDKNIQLYVRKNLKKNIPESLNLGISKSKYENIIWMDADFQHPPNHIKFFDDKQKDYDVVIFSRFVKGSERYFSEDLSKKETNEDLSIFFNKLCKYFLYEDISDYTSGFVCIKKKIFSDYKLSGFYGEYFIDLVVHCKLKKYSMIELPFKERERYSGTSKTFMSYSISYAFLFYHYFLSFLKNYLRKKIRIF